MKYGIQVLTWSGNTKQWLRMRPSKGQPYEWDTREEAENALRLTYGAPEHSGSARVVEIH